MNDYTLSVIGNIVDIVEKKIYNGRLSVSGGKINAKEKIGDVPEDGLPYIMPGFIDAHVHIESSMLVPTEFAKIAVVHGTVATVSDPHEIANVLGEEGVRYMLDNGRKVPFKFHFGAPSCVPATPFETAGGRLDAKAVERLLQQDDIYYLSEMMNFPGVLNGDREVLEKIAIAKKYDKPVDGHAPGLTGDDAVRYIRAGISTDHECFTKAEALNKLRNGMKILIREGSAARNFDALIDLLNDWEDDIMFCSDDKHPDSLVVGHINQLCRRAVAKGIDIFKVLKAACVNPLLHYKMRVGCLREGDPADFIVCDDLRDFRVRATYIGGRLVAQNGQTMLHPEKESVINRFDAKERVPADFVYDGTNPVPVIHALDGQLITESSVEHLPVKDGHVTTDPGRDILKICVINRYASFAKPAVSFIRNFGLKRGAIASSVAHDSHNIIVVGVDDLSICQAVNLIISNRGGLDFVVSDDAAHNRIIPLPVAGLMSNEDGYHIAELYSGLDRAVKDAGSQLGAPFMTLSFMALLVIPKLKLSDKGLFDGEKFQFVAS